MFLRSLKLTNARCIDHLELPFTDEEDKPRRWTLLLGQNGAGKTTVLRAVALMLSGSDALPELLADPDGWIQSGKKKCVIEGEIQTAAGETRSVKLSWERGQQLRQIFQANRKSLDDLDAAIAHSQRNYLVLGYGATRRLNSDPEALFRESPKMPRSRRAQPLATLFRADALLRPLQNWVIDLDYNGNQQMLKTIRGALAKLLPGMRFKGIDKRQKQIVFDTPDGDVPLSRLSEGYQNMAAWCGDMLYGITSIFEDFKNPLEARGLLLVDELDLHLHPVWQRNLRAFLDSTLPNFQIFATSHSPLTAQQSGSGELYALIRPSPQKAPVLHAYRGEPRFAMIHQLLLDPIFELETVDSKRVEAMRAQYRNLKGKSSRKSTEQAKLGELKQKLTALPDWGGETPSDAEHRKVLARIEQVLGRNGAARRGGLKASKPPGASKIAAAPHKRTLKQKMQRATKK